jgi:predicted CopG family antitoxin
MLMSDTATKRIPVTEKTWQEISELKQPGQTFDELLSRMAEREKMHRLVNDLKRIEEEEEFVDFEP